MLLRELREDVQDWDKDENLPPDVFGASSNSSRLELSFMNLEMASIPRTLAPGEVSQPYWVEYLELHRRAFLHDQLDEYPVLRPHDETR
jgi:hypothetical protein